MGRIGFLMACFIFLAGALGARPSSAADPIESLSSELKALKQENEELKARLQRLEAELEALRKAQAPRSGSEEALQEAGAEGEEAAGALEEGPWYSCISLEGGVTGFLLGTVGNSGNDPDGEESWDGSYSFDLFLTASPGGPGSLTAHLEGGEGQGVNDDVPSLSVPNYDAYVTQNYQGQADITISELFLTLDLLGGALEMSAGKMDVSVLFDENEAAGDETTQFASNLFVKSMGVVVPEPDDFYVPAFLVSLKPWDLLELRLVAAAAEEDPWVDLFDDGMLAFELGLRPGLSGREGAWRLYAWGDWRHHLPGRLLSGSAGLGYNSRAARERMDGWGVSIYQPVTDDLSGFFRYSRAEDDLAVWSGDAWEPWPVKEAWSLGIEAAGRLWGRPGDALGIAYGRTALTRFYRKGLEDPAGEAYTEFYLRLGVVKGLALTWDLQWIQNPGGSKAAHDALVLGLRSQFDF